MRCGLLGGEESFGEPPADGLGADAQVARGYVDRDTGRLGKDARSGWDVRALADTGDACGGERQPGRGVLSVL